MHCGECIHTPVLGADEADLKKHFAILQDEAGQAGQAREHAGVGHLSIDPHAVIGLLLDVLPVSEQLGMLHVTFWLL